MKKIRRLLEKNQHVFRPLTHRYDLKTICNAAKELLDAGVFDSQSKAEAQFPDLFSPSNNACREESEPSDFETTKSEAEAMEMIASLEESIETPYTFHSGFTSYGQGKSRWPVIILSETEVYLNRSSCDALAFHKTCNIYNVC